jgi:cytidylate kinase
MIIAIDGPAGSGKSTIAQAVAVRLDLTYLDTGAMYRAVTLLALEKGVSLDDDDGLGALALDMDLELSTGPDGASRVRVGDRDLTERIREQSVSQKVSFVAAHRKVRHALTVRQRKAAETGNLVLEGRDIGTVVCPQADVKIYLTASVEVRAERRKRQLEEQGICISVKTLQRELLLRDSHDSGRALAPLKKARDAVEIDTSDMTIEEVVDAIVTVAAGVQGHEGFAC